MKDMNTVKITPAGLERPTMSAQEFTEAMLQMQVVTRSTAERVKAAQEALQRESKERQEAIKEMADNLTSVDMLYHKNCLEIHESMHLLEKEDRTRSEEIDDLGEEIESIRQFISRLDDRLTIIERLTTVEFQLIWRKLKELTREGGK